MSPKLLNYRLYLSDLLITFRDKIGLKEMFEYFFNSKQYLLSWHVIFHPVKNFISAPCYLLSCAQQNMDCYHTCWNGCHLKNTLFCHWEMFKKSFLNTSQWNERCLFFSFSIYLKNIPNSFVTETITSIKVRSVWQLTNELINSPSGICQNYFFKK